MNLTATFASATDDWPLYGLIDDIRPHLQTARARGETAALATLIGVDGPSPRGPGAQMLIAADGQIAGYVSGGCVEGSVALIAREVIAQGRMRRVVFGAGSPYADVKLVCGARIEVLIEPAAPEDATLTAVLDAYAQRLEIIRGVQSSGAPLLLEEAAEGATGERADGVVWRRYMPRRRIVVLGGDPVAIALARLAGGAGFETVLARDYGPQTGPAGFIGAYRDAAPSEALREFIPDAWTAIVTTTHDLDADHAALCAALPSPAFYVGALGSRRRLADRIAKLEADGLDWVAVKRLRAPVGLDIGATTPHEIAIAILADIIAAARGKRAM
jgi:xanthine dehydrogenase accessory factor